MIAYALSLLTDVPKSPTVLDNACGPGYVTMELLTAYPDAHIHAVDMAPNMISILESVVASNGWRDRVETAVMNGLSLRFVDESFDLSITNFGIFFFPDPVVGAQEIYRTLKRGGKAVVTCWRKVPFLPILHAVQAIVKPRSTPIVLETLEKWTDREKIATTLREGGFEEAETYEKEIMWWNKGFDEVAKGLADRFVTYVGDQWTEAEKEKILDATMQVLEAQEKDFVVGSEGMIGLQAFAWIAVATK